MGLIGTNPNQIPTNADLGTMAYEDADNYVPDLGDITRASIKPSLNLDFANSKMLDPRITFTRPSIGSYYDSDGILKIAASGIPRFDHNPVTGESLGLLVEEQRTNVVTISEDFNAWTTYNLRVIPNVALAPDGFWTADMLVEDSTASVGHFIYLTRSGSNETVTASVYAKLVASSRPQFEIRMSNFASASTGVRFDLQTGTILNADAASADYTAPTSTITPVGNGWYRCSITTTKAAVNTTNNMQIGLIKDLVNTYTGDNISSIYVWGAQVEVNSFATSYIPNYLTFSSRASTATYFGSTGYMTTAASGVARYDYNPNNLSLGSRLLTEAASTNSATYSEDFSNGAWTTGGANVSVTANQIISPDGSQTADKIQTTLASTVNTGFIHQTITVTANRTSNTWSAYVKRGSVPVVTLNLYNGSPFTQSVLTYNFDTNTVIDSTGCFAYSAISSVNGWVRLSTSLAGNASTSVACRIYVRDQGTSNTTSDYVYAWGAQFEENSYRVSSYIPNVLTGTSSRVADTVIATTSVTRIADQPLISGTNFSSWYKQSEGTIVTSFSRPYAITATANYPTITELNYLNDWNYNHYQLLQTSTNSVTCGTHSPGGITNADMYSGTISLTSVNKTAYGYKTDNFAHSLNNYDIITDSAGQVPPIVHRLTIGYSTTSYGVLNGQIAKIAYYPKRLSNTELQTITL
jgi:hypothetical protein